MVQEMGTHMCSYTLLLLLHARKAFPLVCFSSPFTSPPRPHTALPGSTPHSHPEHAIWQSVLLFPCLSLVGLFLEGSRIQLCSQYQTQDHAQRRCLPTSSNPKTAWFFQLVHGTEKMSCPTPSTWKLVPRVLRLHGCDPDHSTASHALAFRVSRKSWC